MFTVGIAAQILYRVSALYSALLTLHSLVPAYKPTIFKIDARNSTYVRDLQIPTDLLLYLSPIVEKKM
jgi:hypothetical protein